LRPHTRTSFHHQPEAQHPNFPLATSGQADYPIFWDYVTFGAMAVIVMALLALAVFILGLPGRIAIARKHPEADAIYLMGWIGFLAVVPWIQALIWAFKPTDVIDIRHMPRETQHDTDAMIARLTGQAPSPQAPPPQTPPAEPPGRSQTP
jgi:uncharacterized protein DUF3302